MPTLTEYLGCKVVSRQGPVLGRLIDLVARVDRSGAVVTKLVVRSGRHEERVVSWPEVSELGDRKLAISVDTAGPGSAVSTLAPDELRLARDLLDAQILDVSGRHLARVGDIELGLRGKSLKVVSVDIGQEATLRRLGLGFLARRLKAKRVGWEHIHIVSLKGHALQLSVDPRLESRTVHELAGLLGSLHPARSSEILATVGSKRSGEAVSALSPTEAAAALRHLSSEQQEGVLSELSAEQAGRIRPLLSERAPSRHRARSRFARVFRARRHAPS